MQHVDVNLIAAIIGQFRRCEGIARAVLFGSRARGDHSEKSDYDIAIYGALSPTDKAHLRYIFDEELPTLHKIDLLFVDELKNEALLQNIQREGVTIYGKDEE